MKIRHFFITLAILASVSCSDNKVNMLTSQIDSLNTVLATRTAAYEEMNNCLDIIVSGLDSIEHQEQIIYMKKDEVSGRPLTAREIKERIDYLEELLQRHRERIRVLEDSLKIQSDKRVDALKKIIANQQKQLEEKERTIGTLRAEIGKQKEQLKELAYNVETLTGDKARLEEQVTTQGEALDIQDEIINEGYYIMGTRKELKDAGIINTTLLGIGRSKVNLEQAALEKMEKIDIRTFSNEITIPSKKVKILSHMPENSYAIIMENGVSKLFIKDPALFWSLSRILVIEIK